MRMMIFSLVILLATLVTCKPTVYLIRHGEKPADGGVGLSSMGVKRAQCLRQVFGNTTDYEIGHIMAQKFKQDGHRKRPYDTVRPLADDLGLDVDTCCDRDDPDCVADFIKDYNEDGNILISWEHKKLKDIVEALGAKNVESYPSDRFDLIWTLSKHYKHVKEVTPENCPGIDVP